MFSRVDRKVITLQVTKEESVMFRNVAQKMVMAAAVLAVVFCLPSVRAADNSGPMGGVVKGVVKDSSAQPVSGAYVKIYDPEKNLTFMVVSQDGGRFSFKNLPAGKYKVQGVGGDKQSPEVPVTVGSKEAEANVSLTEARAPQLPNSWPFRDRNVNGNEEWDHKPGMQMVAGPGKDVLEAKCEQCHNTTRIALLPQNRAKWAMTVATMRSYIDAGHLSQLTDKEAEEVTDYLGEHYSGLPGRRMS